MDAERLQGKVALVTGAASGIGRATAQRFAQEGARVFCSDVQFEACEATAKSIDEAGGEAIAVACDVTRSEECDAAVSAVVEQAGALDVLANIAGIGIYRHATDYSDDEWRRVIEVNLNGSFFMCRAAIPRLLESKGSIINMASAAGLSRHPLRRRLLGVEGWRGDAHEVARDRIRTAGAARELCLPGRRRHTADAELQMCPAASTQR